MFAGRRLVVLAVALAAAAMLAVLVSISVGAVPIPLRTVWTVVAGHLPLIDTSSDPVDEQIVWELRAPRALLALVVGAGLSVAGVALQALVRNPLADPYVLGVASGASLGAVAVLALGSGAVAGLGLSAAAFAGAMLTMLAVFALARSHGTYTPGRLILAGVALGYLCSSLTSFLQFRVDPQQLQGILFWLLGSVAGATWPDLTTPTLVVLTCTGWLVLQGRRLNALSVGEESAVALGVDVRRFRVELMLVSSVLVGAVIAVSGGIGFVGLVIPHIVRLLVGPDHRRVLPLSALLGGLFLVWVDVASRVAAAPAELPIGIFTAAIGAPFFLWLMRRASRVEGGT
ncbi:MAG: iron ABC transporter permease [Thermoleophilia bacterium]|nr:iron ABC transporter permease [Thermoleophilia bacterium]